MITQDPSKPRPIGAGALNAGLAENAERLP